jgi:ABC-type phosphate transport system substrate-binding protein
LAAGTLPKLDSTPMKSLSTRMLRALALLALTSTAVLASPAVIGNKNLSAEKIDAATLKSVFLGKKTSWDGAGGRVILAVLKSGSVADDFLKASVDMNSSSFNNYWRRLAMTGGGTAPHSFEKEEDLRKYVAETPGAIGFLDSANADASVAVLKPGA